MCEVADFAEKKTIDSLLDEALESRKEGNFIKDEHANNCVEAVEAVLKKIKEDPGLVAGLMVVATEYTFEDGKPVGLDTKVLIVGSSTIIAAQALAVKNVVLPDAIDRYKNRNKKQALKELLEQMGEIVKAASEVPPAADPTAGTH